MERDKALDMALGQIEKQFGKGAIMRMGEESKIKIASIPTGALSLDLALGIGGLPRGRVVEIFGPESSGKCVTLSTSIWTDSGLETIEELFERCGQAASCTSRITDVSESGVRAVNEHGELETIAALTHNNRKPVRRLTLRSGRTIEATHNHPLRVLSDGWIVWKEVGDIVEGDVVVSALFGAQESIGSSGLTEDEGVLLGYLIAEGGLGEAAPDRFCFTNAHDPDVVDEVKRLCRDLLDVEPKQYGIDYHFNSKRARETLRDQYGLEYGTSSDKAIPHGVRTAGPKVQAAFLSALYEGDGWIENGPEIGYCTASEKLAEQLQLLLYGLGIPATRCAKWNTTYERDYSTVLIGPAGVRRFLDTIGFRSARRTEQVARHAARITQRSSHVENIPGLWPLLDTLRKMIGGDREFDRLAGDLRRPGHTDCSRQRLRGIVAWAQTRVGDHPSARGLVDHLMHLAQAPYTYESVTLVEDAGEQPTFDLMVPDTHSFIANGVLSHNTTVALHAIAEAQKAGGIAAFIDAEHALDPNYAAALGVDVEALLVSQPDTGEQALEITDMLVRSGAVDLVAIDSVAALTPRAEIEGEMGDTHVGLQARLMSQALRKLAGTLHKSKTCAIFINQLREKIGVMFGCMSYDTRVTLADGRQEKIGKIVNQRLDVEVLSYDPAAGAVVPKRITNWFDNGVTDKFLQFTVERGGGNGRSQFACTVNHKIRTPAGWTEAQELAVGDRVLQTVPHYLSDFQWEILLGGLMGDGALSPTRSGNGARYRFGHGKKQEAYADWKASLFSNIGASRTTNNKGAVFYDMKPLPELAALREAVYIAGKKVLSHDYLKRLTPLALAVWYMDDGGFTLRSKGVQERTQGRSGRSEICIEAMDEGSQLRLQEHIRDTWGIDSKLIHPGGNAVLQFPTQETAKLHALIAPFVHPSMDDKLLPKYRGRFSVEPVFAPVRQELMAMPIVDVHVKPPTRSMHRFDIEVEGTHNYFVDGVMVHNSPETTPGGRALKFYSSVRLDVRRIESLKDGTDVVGNRVRVKVVKNKCLAAGTQIFDPTTGLTHAVEDIVDSGAGTAVWAADKNGQLQVRPIVARLNQGQQQVIELAVRGGGNLRVTQDHPVLTESGWQKAGDLVVGDRIARPRRAGSFGTAEPVPADRARMLGYLIGDGYVGGKTPVAFVNAEEVLHDDAAAIADSLGCKVRRTHNGLSAHFSHRPGEKNGLLELCRWAGIYGHLAPQKRIPQPFFAEDVAENVVANLLFGIFESDGWISREQTGAIRCGFATTSEQLARQIHWLLLRWGIASVVSVHQPGERRSVIDGPPVVGKLPCWQTRISGIDNVRRFSEALPMWGPRGQKLLEALADPTLAKHRGGQTVYLPKTVTEPVIHHLEQLGLSPAAVAAVVGETAGNPQGGFKQVLGSPRLRRDRVQRLADALDSTFLTEILDEDIYYAAITHIGEPEWADTYDVEVEELHNLVANDMVVHNCAAPFKQAEFDIMYGEGISKEGSLIDVGVEEGIVKKAGAWYTYDGEQLGQGRENAKKFLKEHVDTADEIYKKVTEKLGLIPVDITGADTPDEGWVEDAEE